MQEITSKNENVANIRIMSYSPVPESNNKKQPKQPNKDLLTFLNKNSFVHSKQRK